MNRTLIIIKKKRHCRTEQGYESRERQGELGLKRKRRKRKQPLEYGKRTKDVDKRQQRTFEETQPDKRQIMSDQHHQTK